MLKDIGVDRVIIGHSEQRGYFSETDETVNKEIKKVLSLDIGPIVCIGETLASPVTKRRKRTPWFAACWPSFSATTSRSRSAFSTAAR